MVYFGNYCRRHLQTDTKMSANTKFEAKITKSLVKHCEYLEGGWGAFSKDRCVLWVGCKDKYGYAIKRVTWPSGENKLERAHRVSFMLANSIWRHDVPCIDDHGVTMEISHLCNVKACINPLHLVLETHPVNVSRHHCFKSGVCLGGHTPACLFPRTS